MPAACGLWSLGSDMLRPPYAASRTAPVRAVVLTKAERFENFRNRAIHASPIAFSMPARSSEDTIVSATVTLRNSAPSASIGDPAADQFSRDGPLAGFQIGDLPAELAVLVGEI